MLIFISPSKSQNFQRNFDLNLDFKEPKFLKETQKLNNILKKKSVEGIKELMKISDNLAELNYQRFKKGNDNFKKREMKKGEYNFSPAIFAFSGDVYDGFDLENGKKSDFQRAEKQLRILSGFYGIISPLTLIKPYRLEMGRKFLIKDGREEFQNLYDFGREKVNREIELELKKEKIIINLASNEYFKVIDRKRFGEKIIDIEFLVNKNGKESVIGIYAKRARGEMANGIIKNKVDKIEDLKEFSENGGKFSSKLSKENKIVFLKKV